MDVHTDEGTNRWMDGSSNGWMDGHKYGLMSIQINGHTDGGMYIRMDGCTLE